ncbi:hypothetical protein EV356DRAFT_335996 [Viridothelium virens]|uniref:Uncharacterized protein n=1 Tax=Viridothelium virens TaxID=1048519 RepID=A0A6A6HIW5_VIRVR|nr:hypothetical protein EV356DRAFT_335996 [Viridothelium virens]
MLPLQLVVTLIEIFLFLADFANGTNVIRSTKSINGVRGSLGIRASSNQTLDDQTSTREKICLLSGGTMTTKTTDDIPASGWVITSPTPTNANTSAETIILDSLQNSTNGLKKRALRGVADPKRYVAALSKVISEKGRWVHHIWTDGMATSRTFRYDPEDMKTASGVKGMFGCTCVIIASQRGTYLSHIWEGPTFVRNQREYESREDVFWEHSFESLRDGNDLDPLDKSLPLAYLVAPGEVLHIESNPVIFIITPYTTESQRQHFHVRTELRYEERIKELARALAKLVPSVEPPVLVGYHRADEGATEADELEPEGPAGYAGRAIVEVEQERWDIVDADGRSLCFDRPPFVGTWRLWVEDRAIYQYDYVIDARPQKRDGVSYGYGLNSSISHSSRPSMTRYVHPTASATVDRSSVNVGLLTGTKARRD